MKEFYVNTKLKTPDEERKTTNPTREALENALVEEYNNWMNEIGEAHIKKWDNDMSLRQMRFIYALVYNEHKTPVHDDFRKYCFCGGENIILEPGDYCWKCRALGINSMTINDQEFYYFGLMSGKDYGFAMFGIIYFDGESLRGYVPSRGNVFNPETDEFIGENPNEDAVFVKKETGMDMDVFDDYENFMLVPHMKSIYEDIETQINVRLLPFPAPEPEPEPEPEPDYAKEGDIVPTMFDFEATHFLFAFQNRTPATEFAVPLKEILEPGEKLKNVTPDTVRDRFVAKIVKQYNCENAMFMICNPKVYLARRVLKCELIKKSFNRNDDGSIRELCVFGSMNCCGN